VLVHRNKLAIQLQRPDVYADEDVRVGHDVDSKAALDVVHAEDVKV